MSRTNTIEALRSVLSDLEFEIDNLAADEDGSDAPEDISDVILMTARLFPRIIDHAEGHSPLTAHDVRGIRDTWAWLEIIRQKYGIKEPLPGKAENHGK